MNPTNNLPYGAAEIVELRRQGQRPADMVLVSLVGPLRNEVNPVVMAQPGRSHDWRFLVGLPVLLVVNAAADNCRSTLADIEAVSPATLAVWFADHQDGVNVLLDGYRPSTQAGRRMDAGQRASYAGLGATIPREQCLRIIAEQTRQRLQANAGRFDGSLLAMARAGFRHLFGGALEVMPCM